MTGFDAFICYRRSDGARAARRIRRLLQDYRLPRELRHRSVAKLRVYLDTIYEQATNDFFEGVTLPALISSRHLVVVATPDAANRDPTSNDWMRREIEAFEGGPNADNIILIRAAGTFDGPLPGDLARQYPNIEIIDLRGDGPLAFLNPAKSSRLADETAKLVAPLFRLTSSDMPALRREEERRLQFRLGSAAGGAFAILGAVTLASIFAFISRNNAVDALSRSIFATERTIEAIRSLQAGDVRDNLLASSCDLLDSLAEGARTPPNSLALVACRTERAEAHDRLNEPESAIQLLAKAVAIADSGYERTGAVDDALAVVEARRASLRRMMRTDLPGSRWPTAEFATRALELSNKFKEDRQIPETAAETLQEESVGFLGAGMSDAALTSVDAAIALRDLALAREERLTTRLDQVVTLALKAQICFERDEQSAASDAKTTANAMLAKIDAKQVTSEGLNDRFSEVSNIARTTATMSSRAK